MTDYISYKVHLTDNQKSKIKHAYSKNEDCSLQLNPSLTPNTDLKLTKAQINKLLKAKAENKSVQIKLSKTQLKKVGGFLPFLAALAPAVLPFVARAAATGALGYLGSKVAQKITKGSGVKKGKGIYIPGKKYNGKGIKLPGKN